jgi:hypothetical protein
MKEQLNTYCEEYWWNFGKKTLSFKGELKDLLKNHKISFTRRKTDKEGLYIFHFKSSYGITFKGRGMISDFTHFAKLFILMELVRLGDKSQLYVAYTWRPTVTVNF